MTFSKFQDEKGFPSVSEIQRKRSDFKWHGKNNFHENDSGDDNDKDHDEDYQYDNDYDINNIC